MTLARHRGLRSEAQRGSCREEITEVYEVRSGKTADVEVADLGDGGNDARLLIALAPIAAAVFVVTGVVTAAVVAADHAETRREEKLTHRSFPCPVDAAAVAVLALFPSGAGLESLTNERGAVSFEIPATEPDRGIVVLQIGNRIRRLPYERRPLGPPSTTVQYAATAGAR